MTSTADRRRQSNPAFQAFVLLRIGFTAAPILFGLDKFFNWMVDWPKYLAPWINDITPGSAQDFMYFVGAVEIVAGLAVLATPWIGGFTGRRLAQRHRRQPPDRRPPTYYDVALRDFGLFLAALVLGRLALAFRRDPSRGTAGTAR